MPGTGSVLMGAYLYTILSHPKIDNPIELSLFPRGNASIDMSELGKNRYKRKFTTDEELTAVQHVAVLELAFGYMNQSGLCMYEKFGFKHDPNMISSDCFDDYENLPMIIDFDSLEGEYSGMSIEDKRTKIIQISSGKEKGFPKENICSLRGRDQKIIGILMFLRHYEQHNGSIENQEYADKMVNEIVEVFSTKSSVSELLRYAENPSIPKTRNIQWMFNEIERIIAENESMPIPILSETMPSRKTHGFVGTKSKRTTRKNKSK